MAGRLEFDLAFGPRRRPREESNPMRVLVLGDFSGQSVAERREIGSRPTHRVDVDNLDDVMRRVSPRLNPPSGEITFQRLDDFHPDRLYERLDVFRGLKEARTNPPARNEDLGRLLGKSTEPAVTPAPATAPAGHLDALIRNIVAPHVVHDNADAASYRAGVDAATAEQMRTVLHHPAFQSLEAAWRGVHWLVSSLELDDNLQLHLFDASRDELLADIVAAGGKLAQTGLYRTLVERARAGSGDGWSAIAVLMHFGPSDADIGLLAALGAIASRAGGPILAGADAALVSDDASALAGWQALRRSEAAPWIGLAAPRVLMRLPYGKATDPIESFAFEEFVGLPVHEEFLWGAASLATALLIGRAFSARGWDMEPGDEREISDLPAYTFVRDGEREMQACCERFLTESETNRLLTAGLVPLASRRNYNAVVAVRFQSVSDPPAPLAW